MDGRYEDAEELARVDVLCVLVRSFFVLQHWSGPVWPVAVMTNSAILLGSVAAWVHADRRSPRLLSTARLLTLAVMFSAAVEPWRFHAWPVSGVELCMSWPTVLFWEGIRIAWGLAYCCLLGSAVNRRSTSGERALK